MYAENLISTPEAQADFYPTPKELGKKMLQGIDLGFISTVLEPSAGKGDLIRCLAEESIAQEHRYNPHTLNVDAIEIDPYIRSILKYEYSNSPRQLQTWTAHRVHVIQNVYHTNILLFFFYSNLFSFFWASRLKQAPRRIRRPSVAFTMNNCLCHFMGKMLCKGFF